MEQIAKRNILYEYSDQNVLSGARIGDDSPHVYDSCRSHGWLAYKVWCVVCGVVCPATHVQPLPTHRYLGKSLTETHVKPKGLLHPDELWKHTAFESAAEYAVWCATPTKLGKPTKACPFGGMAKQRYHDWADKIWEKFKLLKREILAATAVRSTLTKLIQN